MIGTTLAHYRVLDKIGQGGMGEVYLAEDLSLKRQVALKVLPEAFAADAERLARFTREAEAVAALNHPNIVTIHSINEAEGVHFLTMELVDGEPLNRIIPASGMAIDGLLRIAIPLADAVAAAHERGITHRDLKAANVMVDRKGRTKVLDFGIARVQRDAAQEAERPTTITAVTEKGQVLGTAAYMAPEQVLGQPVDSRSDIFSLGVILYELATGHRPFQGRTAAEVMSAILRETPAPVTQPRPDHPRQLDRIVRHCLAKEPDARFQTALDLRNELADLQREIQTDAGEASATPARGRRRAVLASGVILGAIALGLVWYTLGSRDTRDAASGGVNAPFIARRLSQLTVGAALEEWAAWSPKGHRLVHSAEIDGYKQLVELPLDGGNARQLTTGPHDHIQADWMPDGRAVVFVRSTRPGVRLQPGDVLGYFGSDGDIWQRDLETGEERRLVADAFSPAVSPDGLRLAFDASWAGPRRIWITDRNGTNPKQVTTATSEAVVHTSPRWSPDGQRMVFRKVEHTNSDILLLNLATETVVPLTNDGFPDLDPVWSGDGRHVYFPSYRGGGGINIWRVPVSATGSPEGPLQQVTTGAGNDLQLGMAPGGDRIAFTVLQQNADIWRVPVDPVTGGAKGPAERIIATTREDSRPAWSRDGLSLAFNSDRSGEMNLWVRSLADGTDQQITRGPGGDYQPHWSPDGRMLVFFSSRSGNADIWTVRVADGALQQLTSGPGLDINPFFSPDGRRIGFQSDRNGRMNVWLMNADGSDQRQASSGGVGGHFMAWSADGKALIFRDGSYFTGRSTRLTLESGTADQFPQVSGAHMSLSPDGSRIMDVREHRTLWAFPLAGAEPLKVLEFPDRDVRIDYPRWSPDGRWVVFDRTDPKGGDIWVLEGLRGKS